jgi:hypothetical protein
MRGAVLAAALLLPLALPAASVAAPFGVGARLGCSTIAPFETACTFGPFAMPQDTRYEIANRGFVGAVELAVEQGGMTLARFRCVLPAHGVGVAEPLPMVACSMPSTNVRPVAGEPTMLRCTAGTSDEYLAPVGPAGWFGCYLRS